MDVVDTERKEKPVVGQLARRHTIRFLFVSSNCSAAGACCSIGMLLFDFDVQNRWSRTVN